MIPDLRHRFNKGFTSERYAHFLALLQSEVGVDIAFRPCETPVFLPKRLIDEMVSSSLAIIEQLDTPQFRALSAQAVPATYNTPNEGAHPHFVQVDFALTEDESGMIVPRLIELQGCASIYAFQYFLSRCYRQCFNLDGLEYLLGGLDEWRYLDLFRRVIVEGHDPEQVVLLEIDPLGQKTLPDFYATEKLTGVRPVCITEIVRRGQRLFYHRDGKEICIRRLYNRVIIDELVRRGIEPPFDFRDELDVEWAGHPNWYFRWSKFALPFLDHPAVPRSWFLDRLAELPANPAAYVLKPLFSFAGSGVTVGPTREELEKIAPDERGDFLLQERVTYAPLIETPDQPSRVEIRIMILWPDDSDPVPVITLARLSRGLMMGVNFNHHQSWVGSSIALFPDRDPAVG